MRFNCGHCMRCALFVRRAREHTQDCAMESMRHSSFCVSRAVCVIEISPDIPISIQAFSSADFNLAMCSRYRAALLTILA